MHKSKENPNGTFSIGKTWNLDDLTAIESYTSPNCDPVKRKLAGETGFTVTLGKPYFWEAQADKEKKFFIASLIKIYGKYTGGRVPELIGFDQRELDQVTGASAGRRQQPPPPREPLPRSDRSDTSPLPTSRSVGPPPSISSTYSPAQTPSLRNETPGRNGASSPAGSVDSARMASQNQAALRRVAGSDKSSESLAPSAASFTARSDDGTAAAGAGAPSLASLPARSRNGVNGLGGLVGRFAADLAEPPAAQRDEKPPPERRRPPMDPTRPREPIDDDLVPAPLMSPGARRDPVAPPPRSNDRSTPLRKDSTSTQRSETSSINKSILGNDSVKNDAVGSLKASSNGAFTPTSTTSTAVNDAANSPSTPPPEPEESRPGLGPMIKKKSKGDIAGAFWKAANAASAFKPRPGGAGDRLRAAANKTSDGPDGITSVVPAPPRPSSTTTEASKTPAPESTPKTAGRDRSSGTQPGVRLSVPGSTGSRPSSSAQPATEATKEASKEASKEADAAAAAEEATRRSIVVGNDVRYLATLGIDPSILDARSTQFAGYLDYFGLVPGEQMRSHTFDDIKADMERELNKAEAGALLARIEVGDERVEAIKKGLDLAISECDELDNLLTLFSVELSVSIRGPG